MGEDTMLKLFQTYSSTGLNEGNGVMMSPMDRLALREAMDNHGLLLLKVKQISEFLL